MVLLTSHPAGFAACLCPASCLALCFPLLAERAVSPSVCFLLAPGGAFAKTFILGMMSELAIHNFLLPPPFRASNPSGACGIGAGGTGTSLVEVLPPARSWTSGLGSSTGLPKEMVPKSVSWVSVLSILPQIEADAPTQLWTVHDLFMCSIVAVTLP